MITKITNNEEELAYLNQYLSIMPKIFFEDVPVNISFMHGFFTAVCSIPNLIKFFKWEKVFFHKNENHFEEISEPTKNIKILLRKLFEEANENIKKASFKPFYYKITNKEDIEEELFHARHWSLGYLLAFNLEFDLSTMDHDQAIMLLPLVLLADPINELKSNDEKENIDNELLDHMKIALSNLEIAVKTLDYIWHNEALDIGYDSPIRSGKKKIGRNDPCVCGSGKKYKKCCLDNHDLIASLQENY
jgi:yecA family protein